MPLAVEYLFLTNPVNEDLMRLLFLYRNAGWWPETDPSQEDAELETVRGIVKGSHLFLTAVHDGVIIGMGRAISDRVSDGYIQDITVDNTWRKKGLGKRIVKELVEKLQQEGLSWIGLIAEKNTQNFYIPMGFNVMENATPMVRIGVVKTPSAD